MSIVFRVVLVVFSLAAFLFCLIKIRKNSMKIDDAVYWFFLTALSALFAVFPEIAENLSSLLGIESPANFVYLIFIFMLMLKLFIQTIKLSALQTKLEVLAQIVAIKHSESPNDHE